MALRQDAETVRDLISRLLLVLRIGEQYKDATEILLSNNPDLSIPITNATKLAWVTRRDSIRDQIKTIVAGW